MNAIKKISLIKKTVALLLVMITIQGCDVNGGSNYVSCDKSVLVGVEDVTGPATATVGQILTFNVSFKVDSSCGNFQSFLDEPKAGTNERTITVKAFYQGCECNLTPIIRNTTYTFTPLAAGTYVLKFKITNTTFKTMTVVVS